MDVFTLAVVWKLDGKGYSWKQGDRLGGDCNNPCRSRWWFGSEWWPEVVRRRRIWDIFGR